MDEKFEKILQIIEKEHKEEEKLTLNSRPLIIDALNNFIRIWVVMPTVNDDGHHIGGITGFLQTIGTSIRALRPTRVFVVLDGKDASKRRKKVYPAYKETRGSGLRLNRAHTFADEEEELKQMKYQMSRVIQYFKNLPITFITIDGIEADDTIAYLTNMCQNKKDLQELFIVSSDKDFYQLVNDKVKIWNPVKKQIVDKKFIIDNFEGIHPKNFILYKSMIGDRSDNIKGIKGLGIKTISKHFQMLKEDKEYKPDDIISYCQNNTDNVGALKKLNDNRNTFLLNYDLMLLADKNVPQNNALNIIDSFNRKIHEINLFNIQKLIKQDKIYNVFKNINSWVVTNFSILNKFAKEG